jgi:hypothetical protein
VRGLGAKGRNAEPPHPRSLRSLDLSPSGRGEESTSNLVLAMHPAPESSSRRKIFFALRTDLRQRTSAVDTGILTIRALSIPKNERTDERKKARKRNAERRVANLRTSQTSLRSLRKPSAGAARAERCALASRRPTTALARGTLVPKALLQARLPGTWSLRALPGVACPSPVAAPHAPVVMLASMMPEAAREQR